MKKQNPSKKALLYAAARWIALAGVIALIAWSFAENKTKVSDAPFETVLAAVREKAGLEETCEGDNAMLRRLYGLDPTMFEAYALFYPSTNMGAREMLLGKLKDASYADTVRAAADQRVQTQIGVFEGYAPEQTALLKNHAVIETPGNYVLLIVDENAAEAAAVFQEVL